MVERQIVALVVAGSISVRHPQIHSVTKGKVIMNEGHVKIGCSGISLPSTLFIVFLVLKLTGVISWSWWRVFAPLWIPLLIALAIFLVSFIVLLLFNK